MSDIPLQLPTGAHVPSKSSALVTFSQAAGGDPVPNAHRLQPIPHQTSVNPWQMLYPVTDPQSVPAVLGPQAVQLVTQRAGEPLNIKEKFLLPLIQCEAAARQNLVNTLARRNLTQLQRADATRTRSRRAIFPRQRELLSRLCQKAYQPLENQREHLVTEVTSSVWRRDEQVYELRTEPSLQALHSEDVTQQQSQEDAGLHQHFNRLGSGNTAISRDVWKNLELLNQPLKLKLNDFDKEKQEVLREVRHQNHDRARFDAPVFRNRTNLESL